MNERDLDGGNEYFKFLDELRETGFTNMYGAGAFLEDEYPELNKQEAKAVLMDWMDSFDTGYTSGVCRLRGKSD
jgi:hypothetical protein|tara:strand:- start:315 stop:536 length:222 start_codon:yes stop_codon:yes gene_type:complete